MKSFKLTGLRQMQMVEVPRPTMERGSDVLVRIEAVGVCGSDVHYYTTGRIGEQVVRYPFAVGHECAGTVVEVGPDVQNLAPGDRVAIEPAVTCGTCDQCTTGRENTCRHNRFLGCPGQIEGSLAEFLVMPETNLFPISDDLDMGAATISEPLAIGIYAARQSGLTQDHAVGILGMGPIGHCVLLPAVARGCKAIYCTDKVPQRVAAATAAGATWVGNPTECDVAREVLRREPHGLDIVFECCGQREALDQAVDLLKPGGKLMVIGIPETDRVSYCPHTLRRKEITIEHVRRQRGCVPEALELIGQRRSEIDRLITHHFPFEETAEAFDLVAGYRDGVVKAMIEFS